MTETPEMSARDKLAEMMAQQGLEESQAMREAAAYLGSSEGKAFRAKMAQFQSKTVPNTNFDQVFGSIIRVLDSTEEMLTGVVALLDKDTNAATDAKNLELAAPDAEANIQSAKKVAPAPAE